MFVFLQFAKVGGALAGPVSEEDGNSGTEGVPPQAFKTLVARGHPEFSSHRQQDAQEYFSYLMDMIAKSEHAGSSRLTHPSPPSAKLFEFGEESRVECLTSHRVSYKTEHSSLLSLDIPLDAAVNLDEVTGYNEREQKRQKLKSEETEEEKVLPKVPLSACLERYAAPVVIDDYVSAYLNAKSKVSEGPDILGRPTC
jgi:ubiquitin carboxyl-terminal hydrolase 5/13